MFVNESLRTAHSSVILEAEFRGEGQQMTRIHTEPWL